MGTRSSWRRPLLELTPLEDRLLCSAQLITDTKPEPFRSVAKVISWWDINHNTRRDNGEVFEATAAMIGPRAALTSAHQVYDPQLGGFATEVTLIPGADGGKPPLGTFKARSFGIPILYESRPYAGDDLAVLNFAQNIGKRSGWFDWAALPAKELKHSEIFNIGYPGDTHSGDQQYFSTGIPYGLTATELRYRTAQLPVEHGSSGSPLYIEVPKAARPIIVGVHSRRIDDGAIGLSARITPLLGKFVQHAENVRGHGGFADSTFDVHPPHHHR
jgi:V8-like Glu-specific endopeptidase